MSKYEFFPKKPQGPVDDAFAQVSWVRSYRPGGPRWLMCGALAVLQVVALFIAVVVLTEMSGGWGIALAAVVAVSGSVALCLLILRLALTGVWVSDTAVRVISLTRYSSWPWARVADVWFDVDGDRRLVVVLDDGTPVATPIHARTLDFAGRPEALAVAAECVQGWYEQARKQRRG